MGILLVYIALNDVWSVHQKFLKWKIDPYLLTPRCFILNWTKEIKMDGARVVPSGQIYRQMFDAQVDLDLDHNLTYFLKYYYS